MSFLTALVGDLTKIRTGKLDANAAASDGKYPFFTCAQEPLRIDRYAYDCDAILVAGNGDLNVKHYKGKFEAYQRTYIIEVRKHSRLDSRYLYYFMSKYVEKLRELAIGGVIKYIKLGMLTDAEIPLPSISEQKRIAAILDKADAILRKRQQAIKLADDFLRATFLDMFGDPVTNPKGWPVFKMAELLVMKPQIGTIVPAKQNGGYLNIRVGELGNYNVALEQSSRVTVEEAEFNRYLLKPGDFLFARAIGSEEHLGKASVFQGADEPVLFDSHVMRLRFNRDRLHSTFFFFWLGTKGGRARFMRKAGRTAVQFNVNSEQIADLEIPLPTFSLQGGFVSVQSVVHRLRVHQEQFFQEQNALFVSLSQRAFLGDL